MLITICILILACCILGKYIKPLGGQVRKIDWRGRLDALASRLRRRPSGPGHHTAGPSHKSCHVTNDDGRSVAGRQHAEEVYALVESLRKKHGVECSIEELLAWHRNVNIPESMKEKHNALHEALASMCRWPEDVRITESACPDCGSKTIEFHLSSAAWTWHELCGRSGRMTLCPECLKVVDFIWEAMS